MAISRFPKFTAKGGHLLQRKRKQREEASGVEKYNDQATKKTKNNETLLENRIYKESIAKDRVAIECHDKKNGLVRTCQISPSRLDTNSEGKFLAQGKSSEESLTISFHHESEAIVQFNPSKEQIGLLDATDAQQPTDENQQSPQTTIVAESTLALKCHESLIFDQNCFLEVMNQIYDTLSSSETSLLLGQSSSDAEFDDSHFTNRLFTAIVDDDAFAIAPARLDSLDDEMVG